MTRGTGLAEQLNYLLKEALCRSRIAFGREQEIDGLSSGVHSPIQILLLALHPYIGFIDTVACLLPLMLTTTFTQFRRVRLDPAPHAAAIHAESALSQQFGYMLS